jgi:hypothetical protein
MNAAWTPTYAEARSAHIAAADATDGYRRVSRPGGRLIGRLTRKGIVPITAADEAAAIAREKRQDRIQFK